MTKKLRQKLEYLENEKNLWREIFWWKHFSSFLKDFQLPKIVSDLIVRFENMVRTWMQVQHLQTLGWFISLYLNFTPELEYISVEISYPISTNQTSNVTKQSCSDVFLEFDLFNNGFCCTKFDFSLTIIVNI